MLGDFAALIQKRNTSGSDPAKQAFTLEMDGGANPNKVQFVLARDLFLKNAQVINTDKYYIINVNHQGVLQTASFITDGVVEGTNFYNVPVQATAAPLLLAGFQPMNVAEVILFNSDVNMAQINIVTNALAAKYGLSLTNGNAVDPGTFKYDLIGIGKARNITDKADDVHLYASGGAIELKAASISSVGDYVFAGNDGVAITENATTKQWSRSYFMEAVGSVSNVTLGFDFGAVGLTTVPDNTFKLLYKSTEAGNWIDLGISPVYDAARKVLNFSLATVEKGYYTVTKDLGTGVESNVNHVDFTVYPNPASDRLTVNLNNSQNGRVEFRIVDLTGRALKFETEVKQGSVLNRTIDVSNLEKGSYILEVNQAGKRSVSMFNKK